MNSNNRRNWSRQETILAFDLYVRTPFGKIDDSNEEIKALAKLINRTPSAVALKMSNLAHFDPALRSRNVSGMSHTSKLDSEIFNEFCKNLGELKRQAIMIKDSLGCSGTIEDEIRNVTVIPGETKEQMVRRRIGQSAFRMAVLNAYENRCCVTGLYLPKLLIASHIKPWAVSDDATEKTNPCNGLCLNAFHDRAFDQGYITISKDYTLIISPQLKDAEMDDGLKKWINEYNQKEIMLPNHFHPAKEFIEYHNDVVFLR